MSSFIESFQSLSDDVVTSERTDPAYLIIFDCYIKLLFRTLRIRFLWMTKHHTALSDIQRQNMNTSDKIAKIATYLTKALNSSLSQNHTKHIMSLSNPMMNNSQTPYTFQLDVNSMHLAGVIYPSDHAETPARRKEFCKELANSKAGKFNLFGQPDNLFVWNNHTMQKFFQVLENDWFKFTGSFPDPINIRPLVLTNSSRPRQPNRRPQPYQVPNHTRQRRNRMRRETSDRGLNRLHSDINDLEERYSQSSSDIDRNGYNRSDGFIVSDDEY